jgi:hypothetical protein
MSPDRERREPPKRKAAGKDGLESDEEGGLLVVQHGEPRKRVDQHVTIVTLVSAAVSPRYALNLRVRVPDTPARLNQSCFHMQDTWSAESLLSLSGWSSWG